MIARIIREWSIPPQMSIELVEDIEGAIWIHEVTPVGSHFWTVEQARELKGGAATGGPLAEAIRMAPVSRSSAGPARKPVRRVKARR
ncbi:MAG TPA: hypothetical protein VGS41_11310 [Chthonomonadales bacterium]|nr:hypothetical protein [Chthonomonadales bacterium]